LSKPERELGLGLQSDKTANEYVRIGQQAEAAGFDVVSVFHDLGFQPAIVPLTLIAHATDRIRLGPAALNPYTLHPFEIANQIAALDLVSRGRAYAGIVQGAWLEQLGLHEPRPRFELGPGLGLVRALSLERAPGRRRRRRVPRVARRSLHRVVVNLAVGREPHRGGCLVTATRCAT
jgi:5,10-methylenetetrahydromethanopterin reductase